jgi:hypothetical protein
LVSFSYSRLFRFLFLAFGFIIADGLHSQNTFDYFTHIGIVVLRGDGTMCLTISNTSVADGTEFSIIFPSMPGSPVKAEFLQGKVVSRAPKACDIQEGAEKGDMSYLATVTNGMLITQAPYIAVLVRADKLRIEGNDVTGDLDGDGTPEYFRQCTSSEGVHLTVWSGKPLEGKRRWHRYFYLGYDVVPSCEESDFSE